MKIDESKVPAGMYARVSSDRQDVDLSISAQLKALQEYADRNGYHVVSEYVDEAESGLSIDRPGFKAMIGAARQTTPPFRVILVWKLSRFARNREDSIIYQSLLRKQGVQVVSINEPVEDTPSGRLLEGIIEVIDEFYSANLSQDVLRGMRECASRGFYPERPIPYGYRRVKVQDGDVQRTKLEPDPALASIAQRMFRECLSGKGLVEIGRSHNADGLTTRTGKPWTKTTVHKVLHNEGCVGVLIWDRASKHRVSGNNSLSPARVEGAWPPVVDREVFDQVQAMLASRAPRVTHSRVARSEYILSGMIRCRGCGTAMIGHAVKSGSSSTTCVATGGGGAGGSAPRRCCPKSGSRGSLSTGSSGISGPRKTWRKWSASPTMSWCGTHPPNRNGSASLKRNWPRRKAGWSSSMTRWRQEFGGWDLAPRIRCLFQRKEDLMGRGPGGPAPHHHPTCGRQCGQGLR